MKTKKILSLLLSVAMICTLFSAFGISASATETIHTANDWKDVPQLIENANENDIIDVSNIQKVIIDQVISVKKSIVIKGDATINDNYYNKLIKGLRFTVNNGSTLTLENLYIENIQLTESAISGEGNLILKNAMVSTSTENGTATVYNAPAMINMSGDVTVIGAKATGDDFSAVVTGATVLDREGDFDGKAGTAIKAKNITINNAMVQGGTSFEQGVDGGDALVSTQNVVVKGGAIYGGPTDSSTGYGGSGIIAGGNIELSGTKRYDEVSDDTFFDTYVIAGAGGYMPGVPVRFTDNSSDNFRARKLIMNTAKVKGTDRANSNPAAPYIVEMGKNDIAIINDSYIGWYPDIPLFSDGYYKITNPFATWGTFDNATYIENPNVELSSYSSSVSATAGIPAPTYTVTIPATVDFGEQKQALSKYADKDKDQYGNDINVSVPLNVSATNVDNLFDDLGKKPQIDVSVTFDGLLKDNGTSSIPYTVKSADSSSFTSGNVFCSFTNSSEVTGEQKASGTVWMNRTNITKSANFTGTMTFTISIPDKA